MPGVYATTQVRVVDPGASLANTFTYSRWPPALGTAGVIATACARR